MRDARRFNEGDHLFQEALFLVHDYLHTWACRVIDEELPELGLGTGRITPATFERYVFAFLLTEAAATVGLDYWCLATTDFGRTYDLGSRRGLLTVSYHERDLDEFRRFAPELTVQEPEMFAWIARFYCTGELIGFDRNDIERSERLHAWLRHELIYGRTQRILVRSWLAHLSRGAVTVAREQLDAPIAVRQRWQRKLVERLGARLWAFVKEAAPPPHRVRRRATTWTAGRGPWIDFRFTNLRALAPTERKRLALAEGPRARDNFRYYFAQRLSSIDFDSIPPERHALLRLVREHGDEQTLEAALGPEARELPPSAREPRDLFFPS